MSVDHNKKMRITCSRCGGAFQTGGFNDDKYAYCSEECLIEQGKELTKSSEPLERIPPIVHIRRCCEGSRERGWFCSGCGIEYSMRWCYHFAKTGREAFVQMTRLYLVWDREKWFKASEKRPQLKRLLATAVV